MSTPHPAHATPAPSRATRRCGSIVLLAAWIAAAWPPAAAGQRPPAFGYRLFDHTASECAYQLIDITASGTALPLIASGSDPARDDGGAVVALAAPFELYGRSLTSLVVSSNGYLGAASSLAREDGGDFSNDPFLPAIPSNAAAAIGRIAVFHDELSGEASGGVVLGEHFAVCPRPSGAIAGEACSVLQWSNWGLLGSAGSFDVQTVLYHGSFAIALQLHLGGLSHSGATLGIQSFDAGSALQYLPAAALTGDVAVCLFEPRFPAGGPVADLSVSKTDKTESLVGASEVTYEIVARNAGPSPVSGATLSDPVSAPLEACSWTCSASPGSSCAAAGAGSIAEAVDLEVDGWVTFELSCDIAAGATGSVTNVASIAVPAGVLDPVPDNDTAGDVDPVPVELLHFTVE